jgi:DNA-binding IclR family transcriptional regulator
MAKAESPAADKEIGGPRSLTRLLGLFDALARSPNGLTLADLNVLLESPKSSLLNLLRPLVSEGYLMHDGSRYRLGPAIFRLSASIMSVWNFSKVLHPYLEELAERCHETVVLGVLDRQKQVQTLVDVVESPRSIRFSVPLGTTVPLYCTPGGRLLLTHSDKELQEAYLREVKLEQLTPRTITNKKALRAELQKVREDGYAIGIGEYVLEAAAVAAPIFGADGQVVAVLNVAVPSARFEQELPMLRQSVLEVAARASGRAPQSAPVGS